MIKKTFGANTLGSTVKSEILSNQQLTEELNKPVIRKFERQKVHLSFVEKIWSTDLAHMQIIKRFN